MPRILTIDDSSTIRSIITKQMTDLGFEVDHAENGQHGLTKLEARGVDLILLDVTMPVMDGPTMLAALRERGDRTPVIMLTSESKRSIVAGAVKLGIEDYILKPFKPDELRSKVVKALRVDASSVRPAGGAAAAAPAAGKPVTDLLVIDDMENVHKKLRGMLPAQLAMTGCTTQKDAVQACQERSFRAIVIDLVIPDVNSVALMTELRALQPQAVMVALALRSAADGVGDVKNQGFGELMFKPFEAAAVEDFVARHLGGAAGEVLSVDGNILECAAFTGKDDKLDGYFARLRTQCQESLVKLASACYDDTIFDLSAVPLSNDKIVDLVTDSDREAKKLGITLRVVGSPEVKRLLGGALALPIYATRAEAQSAG